MKTLSFIISLVVLLQYLDFISICSAKKSKSRKSSLKRRIETEEEIYLWNVLEDQIILGESKGDFEKMLFSISEIMMHNKWNDITIFLDYMTKYHELDLLAVALSFDSKSDLGSSPYNGQIPVRYYSFEPTKYWIYFISRPYPQNLQQFWGLIIEQSEEYIQENFSPDVIQQLKAMDNSLDPEVLEKLKLLNNNKLKDAGILIQKPEEDDVEKVEI